MPKIGIMGGTFDPIHNGHLLLGKQAYLEYHLDEIWYMPSASPPHKQDHKVTDAFHRCCMVELAVEDYSFARLSTFETEREGTTYTAQTLKLLHQQYPEHTFYFIVGADSIFMIENWYHPQEVLQQAVLLVADREVEGVSQTLEEKIAYLEETYQADIRLLHSEEVDISSEQLRRLFSNGKPVYKYVPKAVEEYIRANGLYKELDIV